MPIPKTMSFVSGLDGFTSHDYLCSKEYDDVISRKDMEGWQDRKEVDMLIKRVQMMVNHKEDDSTIDQTT